MTNQQPHIQYSQYKRPGPIKYAKIEKVEIDFQLKSIKFLVEADYHMLARIRNAGIDTNEWRFGACVNWLRQNGITRHQLSDIKFNKKRNDVNKYRGYWVLTTTLTDGEDIMLKMNEGLDST